MTFQIYGSTGVDTPPELENLRGLSGVGAFGAHPGVWAATGGAAAGVAIAEWLANDEWSAGEYNDTMRAMDGLIHELDKLGWETGCWNDNPAKYRQWRTFAWGRFSKHYNEFGMQNTWLPLTDNAEKPARNLLRELRGWVKWFEKTCHADVGPSVAKAPADDHHAHDDGGGGGAMGWLKWGAIGLGALAALGIAQSVRGAFPRGDR